MLRSAALPITRPASTASRSWTEYRSEERVDDEEAASADGKLSLSLSDNFKIKFLLMEASATGEQNGISWLTVYIGKPKRHKTAHDQNERIICLYGILSIEEYDLTPLGDENQVFKVVSRMTLSRDFNGTAKAWFRSTHYPRGLRSSASRKE